MSRTDTLHYPFVSVIIPAYNDEHGIRQTLTSLQQQDYPAGRWEVIVVDNNSTDKTGHVAHLILQDFLNAQSATETKQSSYAARNAGIRISKGDILAFIDSDITVPHDWITKGVEDIIRENADYVGCSVEVYTTGNPPSISEIYNQRTSFPVKQYMQDYGFAPTAALFVRKGVFENIGPFDERLVSGGDYEFGTRVRNAGLKMHYNDNNSVRHPARTSVKSILKKTTRIARGYVDLRMLYPERFGRLSFYSLLVYFIIIPIKIPDTFLDLRLRDRVIIFALRLITHYTNIIYRLSYWLRIKSGRSTSGTMAKPSPDRKPVDRTYKP